MSAHLIIFAKAPLPGQVKTRLAAAVGAEAAAGLAARMLAHTLAQAVAADLTSIELCGSPAGHPLLASAAERAGVALTGQVEGDLGRRMGAAFRRTLARHRRVLMIGTDCPALRPADLAQAAAALSGCDAFLRPTDDGGYILIGLSRFHPRLFEAMPWSTPAVMEQTRLRLRRLGWRWQEGTALADVDEPADLALLPTGWWPPGRVGA